MITRRRLLQTAAPLLISCPALARRPFGGGGSQISPDGTIIFGNTGGTITNLQGTWNYGDQFAPGGGASPDGNRYCIVQLNGRELLDPSGVEGQPIVARNLTITRGGYIYAVTFSTIWNVFDNYQWQFDGGYPPGTNTLHPLPSSIVTPPFTPSPDGTIITPGSGTITSIDGVWNITGGGTMMLNGIQVTNYSPVAIVEINSHGQIWFQQTGGTWFLWQRQVAIPFVSPPTSSPIPIGISMSPSNNTTILSNAALNTVITTVTVTMSDGSPFAGTYTVGGNGAGHVYAAMSGNNAVMSVTPMPDFGTGTREAFSITATQNGFSCGRLFAVNPPA